jgi:hypothetical protein
LFYVASTDKSGSGIPTASPLPVLRLLSRVRYLHGHTENFRKSMVIFLLKISLSPFAVVIANFYSCLGLPFSGMSVATTRCSIKPDIEFWSSLFISKLALNIFLCQLPLVHAIVLRLPLSCPPTPTFSRSGLLEKLSKPFSAFLLRTPPSLGSLWRR